ncbi:hypothetical protein MMC09_004315 [Bachmanniomyces sp. S44760]|nr:hypothetical protein [Bachmanniomyces sp. S44760]
MLLYIKWHFGLVYTLLLARAFAISPNLQLPFKSIHPALTTSSLLSLHKDLVGIQSISGNEHQVGNFLSGYLQDHNFTVEIHHVDPLSNTAGTVGGKNQRFNVFAYLGNSRKTRVLVSSHIDTVPPYWPYKVREQDDIWGRGTVDAKGSVAAQITATKDLLAAGDIREGDVSLLFVVGEEVGGDGMVAANALNLTWEAVIFGEPTELKLASGHKGVVGFKIKATGKAGHSGYPWLGENANSMLIPALAVLDKIELPSSKKYGNTTLNIGRIEGGVAANVIAESSQAQIQMRLAAGTAEDAKRTVLELVKSVDERLEVSFVSKGYGPIDIDCDVEGFDKIVVNYGTDIPNLHGDHKKYLYGPGSILVAHSDHEHVTARDLEEAVEGYKKLITAALACSETDVRET